MLGFFSKKEEKEKISDKRKQELEEKKRKYEEKKKSYLDLIGCEVNVGLGVTGVIDGVYGQNMYYDDTDQHDFYFNIRILSKVTQQPLSNMAISSGVVSEANVKCHQDKIFEHIHLPCPVIIKLNPNKQT